MYKVISTAVDATATKVPSVPRSIQLQQDDLIVELNQFYVEITGDGISPEFEAELREHGCDMIMELIQEKKENLLYSMQRELMGEDY